MSVKGAIGIAVVALLAIVVVALVAIVAYALLTGEDGAESQSAQLVPTTSSQTESEAERRTRLCEAALQGGDRYIIHLFCTEPGSPTPPTATPTPAPKLPAYMAQWCWTEKAALAINQIIIDYDKAFAFDYREIEEDKIVRQRKFEEECGGYELQLTRSDGLDDVCKFGRDREYEWRQQGFPVFWTGMLANWQNEYCQ